MAALTALSVTPGMTDKGLACCPAASGLEIYSLWSPVSLLLMSGLPPSQGPTVAALATGAGKSSQEGEHPWCNFP